MMTPNELYMLNQDCAINETEAIHIRAAIKILRLTVIDLK